MEHLIDLDRKHFLHPTSSIQQQQKQGAKLIVDKGEGIYLTDIHGNTFIDAMSSLWNVHIGHGREELAEAAADQMKKLAFSSAFSTFSHEPGIRLAEKIASISPDRMNTVFFTSGGSESNDTAIKLVRHYWKIQGQPGRRKIIALKRAYHGVAAASTSATGIQEFWDMAGHIMNDFVHAETSYQRTTKEAAASLRQKIEEEGPETIAAFIAEPVQGAGGVLMPSEGYFREVRKLCDEYGILFIADEVITGFGRTGEMFGLDNWGVIPDVMTFAKGVTSGYMPLGGVVISDKIHEVLIAHSKGTLFHGFTYSGHPTAAAVGLKNIELIEEERLIENSRKMGVKLLEGFKEMRKRLEIVGDVRALGLLGAVELVKNPETNESFAKHLHVAPRVIEELHKRGVICRAVTYEQSDIICFAPPLIIKEDQISEILDRLYDSILTVQKELQSQAR
ncbi:aspartate aminotransferase family protein [Halobacillus sp. Marseille-Q1614]|uniref:aminotransferase family protein n=1 Tax=Halobacillus sp. Marseille-Q1614 TaxID=2709134 RepID=UPI001570D6D3|nr:aspartate aminotransferase family protein [Halobacillus sp. Marseille-Q1614]